MQPNKRMVLLKDKSRGIKNNDVRIHQNLKGTFHSKRKVYGKKLPADPFRHCGIWLWLRAKKAHSQER